MALELWHIGKKRNDAYEELTGEYLKRLKRYASIKFRSIRDSKARSSVQRIKEEEDVILSSLKGGDYLVLLDEKGEALSTKDLVKRLSQKWMYEKRVVFLIGGAFGVSDEIKARANETVALSKMVMPHQLARLIFTEQLYRAFTIINNENYHH